MERMWGESSVEIDALKAGRGKLFDEGNYAMFIHWGLYSHLGGIWRGKTYYGIGEWILNPRMAGIPVAEYKEIANEFNPVDFDAKAIVQLAKDAGMRYIIITSKHHEGFAMFHSTAHPFNIVDATPFGRDPMGELSAACRAEGLGFGFYYSHYQDWTAPGGAGGPTEKDDGTEASFEDYFYAKCLPQVREICTQYGKIDFVWFDTPGDMKKELVVELAEEVRRLQPDTMLCSRVGHGMGDYASLGDMDVPPRNVAGLWETCDTNNDSWSYAWYDTYFKSPKEILHRLVATVARGGTYLFNVGPTGKGAVPETGARFLRAAGEWIARYPQVVYGAGASPWGHALPWGDVTVQEGALYLSVFDWPQSGRLYVPGLHSPIKAARILSSSDDNGTSGEEITSERVGDWTVLHLPYKPADRPAAVIEVEIEGGARNAQVDQTLGLDPEIPTVLLAEFAGVEGAEKEAIRWMEKFGEWKHVNQVSAWGEGGAATWEVDVCAPGPYRVDLRYRGEGRLVWRIETDEGAAVQNQQAATEKYQIYPMGVVEFAAAGRRTLRVCLVEGDAATSSLESVRLEPITL